MMGNISLRDARDDEAGFIVRMIREMVTDMAGYGGNAPATDNAAWEKIVATIADELRGTKVKYLIAETVSGDAVGIAGAELITLGGAFAPKKTLHITAVYVLPPFRRSGIGGALLTRILDWGRAAGSEQCDLNVLNDSPAKSLYERASPSSGSRWSVHSEPKCHLLDGCGSAPGDGRRCESAA